MTSVADFYTNDQLTIFAFKSYKDKNCKIRMEGRG